MAPSAAASVNGVLYSFLRGQFIWIRGEKFTYKHKRDSNYPLTLFGLSIIMSKIALPFDAQNKWLQPHNPLALLCNP